MLKIDACPSEHILYRGCYAQADRCPTAGCKTPERYNEDTESFKRVHGDGAVRERTGRHVLRYSPLIPRLRALIAHPVFSHLFYFGDRNMKSANPDVADDIHQCELYARFARVFPLRSEGAHGICDIRVPLGLSADRASLSKHKMRTDFAALPILLNIISWPLHIRSKEKYLLLSALPPLKSHNPALFFGNNKHAYSLLFYTNN